MSKYTTVALRDLWSEALRSDVAPVTGQPLDSHHRRSLRRSIRRLNRHIHFDRFRVYYSIAVGVLLGSTVGYVILPLIVSGS